MMFHEKQCFSRPSTLLPTTIRLVRPLLLSLIVFGIFTINLVQAQTLTVLQTFHGNKDGGFPLGLILDSEAICMA